MRKMFSLLMVAVLLMAMAAPAFAEEVQPRAITIRPSLPINGTTADCTVRCVANNIADELEATIVLYRGDTEIETWVVEGNGYIFFSEYVTVSPGEYTLSVDLTVNGDPCPTASVSNTCTG